MSSVESVARRTTVQYWHTSYSEPCENGPANADDVFCAEHQLLVTHAGHNGWPADLNDLR